MKLLPSELTLAKVLVTLTFLLIAIAVFLPHQAWQYWVAAVCITVGAGVLTVTVVVWMRRGSR